MAANPIVVHDLGAGGVNVDDEPYDLADNELLRSQNATITMNAGRLGSLQTRKGYAQFNTVSFGAPVMGGIEAPYLNTAGAPSSGGGGGGLPGDSGGTAGAIGTSGSQAVAPGDTLTVGALAGAAGVPQSAAGALTSGSLSSLFGGSPLVLIGRFETSGTNATTVARSGWYLTTEGMANVAYRLNATSAASGAIANGYGPPGYNPEANESSLAVGVIDLGQGSSCRTKGQKLFTIANGNLYYPEQVNNQGTDLISVTGSPKALTFPSIRKMSADGKSDMRILTLPDNIALSVNDGTGAKARISYITSMVTQWGNGDAMFVSVVDAVSATGTTVSQRVGRILYITGLDGGSYTTQEIFNYLDYEPIPLTGSYVPYTLANFMGNLWVGGYLGNATGTGAGFNMYSPLPSAPKGWGITHAASVGTGDLSDTTCLQEYSGALYVGTINRNATGAPAQVFRYASDTSFSSVLTGSGGTLATKNFFSSMEVFNGNLYTAYYNGGTGMTIYKYDGTSWTGVYTGSAPGRALNLKSYDGYLYAWGGSGITATSELFLVTTDGSSWTDASAKVATATGPYGNLQTSASIPVLFKVTQ